MNVRTSHRFLGNFWIRPEFGRSIKLMRNEPLAEASPDIRLASALLRADKQTALEVLKHFNSPSWAEKYFADAFGGNLAALFYELIYELELHDELEKLKMADGDTLLNATRSAAARASIGFTELDNKFVRLLDVLDDDHHVVWLKGPVLARSLYKKPQHRLSIDFDLLISRPFAEIVFEKLISSGFLPIWNDPGQCGQFGVGPVGSLKNVFIAPGDIFEDCHNLTLTASSWPYIELKFDPLEQGLRMKELDRFFSQAEIHTWEGRNFLGPNLIDHLILELVHLHKHGFQGWSWIYDIHLLLKEIANNPANWTEFLRRCHLECIEASAWAGLGLVVDRLDSPVPEDVLMELEPKGSDKLFKKLFLYTVDPEFIWNIRGLPALLLNASLLGDTTRKRQALATLLFPERSFLSAYYWEGKPLSWVRYIWCLFIHWLVVILPSGIVRRSFGLLIWKPVANVAELSEMID